MDNENEQGSLRDLFIPLTTSKVIFLLTVIGVVIFGNGLFNHFVGDDLGQIVDNVYVHSLVNISTFFTGSTFFNGTSNVLTGNYYRPLFLTYFSTIYSIFGANYFAFHAIQLALHIGNSFLVFWLFKKFFKISYSFVLSLVFLVHPINSEVVLYISDAQELLFFFFGTVSLLVLENFKSQKTFITAYILLLSSLLAKETGVLFVGITSIYSYLFLKKKALRVFLIGMGVFVLYLILRIYAVGFIAKPSNSTIASHTFVERLITLPSIFFYYLKTFIFPLTLSSNYQWIYTKVQLNTFWIPLFVDLAFLSSAFFLAWLVYKKYRQRYFKTFLFFSFWFFLGIVLHMQIFPLDATVAEGWFYFPMVGLLGVIGIIFEICQVPAKNKLFLLFFIAIIFLLSIRTFIRTFDWRDSLTIASHDITISKDSWGLENALSYAYFQKGKYDMAKVHAQNSINLHPFMTNYLNLGAAEFASGNHRGAKEAFMKSLKYGDIYQTYDNLALLSLSYGDPEENLEFIKKVAIRKYPKDAQLWLYLSALEYNFGSLEKAKYEVSQAYLYDKGPKVSGVYDAIMNNKPVRIGLKND